MNKRNTLKYLVPVLGALFVSCFSQALILGEGVPTNAAIELAAKLKANRSMAYGYSEDTPDSFLSSYPVHFITPRHVLALVDEPESIQKIKYEIGPQFFIPIAVKSYVSIQEVGSHQLVLYELDQPIDHVRPFKLPVNSEKLSKLLTQKVYIFTYGNNPYDNEETNKKSRHLKAAFTEGAKISKKTISVPFKKGDEEESEFPEPSSFLFGLEDFGSALVSRKDEDLTLLGLGYGNDLREESSTIPYDHQSYFVALSNEVLEKIRALVPDLNPQDASQSSVASAPMICEIKKEPEDPEATSLNFGTPFQPLDFPGPHLTNEATQQELNLFDDPVEWKAGDEVTILPDGIWIVKHPNGDEERRVGLVPSSEKLQEPLTFKVKQVIPGQGSVKLENEGGPAYRIYSNGAVQAYSSGDNSLRAVHTNGWVFTSKKGVAEWEYKDPQNSSLNKERSYRGPKGVILTVYPSGEIKWENSDGISIRYCDRVTRQNRDGITRIEYNDGSEELSLPNGMVFKKAQGSEWNLTSSITEHKKPHKAISHTLPDGAEIFVSSINGGVRWTFKDGSAMIYSLDGQETVIPPARRLKSPGTPSSSSAGLSRPHNGAAQVPAIPSGAKPAPGMSTTGFSAPIGMSLNNTPLPRAGTLPLASVGGASASSTDNSSLAASSTTRSAVPSVTRSTSTAKNVASIENLNSAAGKVEEITYSDGEKRITLPNGMVFEKKQESSYWVIVRGGTRRLNDNFLYGSQDGTRVTIDALDGKVEWSYLGGCMEVYKEVYSATGRLIISTIPGREFNSPLPRTARVPASPARSNGAVQMATPGGLLGPSHTFSLTPARTQQGFLFLPQVRRNTTLFSMGSSNGTAKPGPSRGPQSNSLPSERLLRLSDIPQPPLSKRSSQGSTQSTNSSSKLAPSASSHQAPIQHNPTPQTPGVEAYEKLKKELGSTPTIPEIARDGSSKEIKFPHGVEYDLEEKSSGKSKESVAYTTAGLCLTKTKGSNLYKCRRYLCAGFEPKKCMYASGVIEVCDPTSHKITVYYPTGESLHIHCESGTVESYDTNNNLSSEGTLFGDQSTAALNWDENRGLTAHFIPIAPTPPSVIPNDVAAVEQTSTTKSTQNSSPSTTSTGSSVIENTQSTAEKSRSVRGSKRKGTQESSPGKSAQPQKSNSSKKQKSSKKDTATSSTSNGHSRKRKANEDVSNSNMVSQKKGTGEPKRKRGRPRKNPANVTENTSNKSTHKASKSRSSKKSKPSPTSDQAELTELAEMLEKGRTNNREVEGASLLASLSQTTASQSQKSKTNDDEEEEELAIDESCEEEED